MTNKAIVAVSDIVNPGTGKTIKQENLEKTHAYPLGSIVKCLTWNSTTHEMEEQPYNLVLRVLMHGRDCDGTPLYYLGYQTLEQYQKDQAFLERSILQVDGMTLRGTIAGPKLYGGIGEDSLKLLALPENIPENTEL